MTPDDGIKIVIERRESSVTVQTGWDGTSYRSSPDPLTREQYRKLAPVARLLLDAGDQRLLMRIGEDCCTFTLATPDTAVEVV